jgi:hypothetical protein
MDGFRNKKLVLTGSSLAIDEGFRLPIILDLKEELRDRFNPGVYLNLEISRPANRR